MKKTIKCMAGILALTLAFAQVTPVSVFAAEAIAVTAIDVNPIFRLFSMSYVIFLLHFISTVWTFFYPCRNLHVASTAL